ncbi:DUF3105 domain-containing protein [Actinoalloteichus hymeniacidonis]|uniref:DUF3105 family protein n=1 Tax=Actinoalloteichus hymeniacidonis TaxID=340345 RepID=A0AAC9MWI5_9PSEU|nr:DUF3105 domain-containing protein [Actinoalloteichus hymeniacidonis]AOS62263.1 putative DUF3105 family protein [Actinoalloteichus hymeniacidonis]MBB5909711.1 hypothetical protein [Actinoalloteichus hymeniacidonis]
MASGKSAKALRNARAAMVTEKQRPWGTVAAVAAVVVFAAGVFGYVYVRYDATEDIRAFTPTAENQDPSTAIEGIVIEEFEAQQHVVAPTRVAYESSPPFGGPHDGVWAGCNGEIYDEAVRTENLIHSLEHGAVWIAYNPDQVEGEQLGLLEDRVRNQAAMVMSPYPGLDSPISLQAWGHQLKLDDASDERIDQFIMALQLNAYTYPEVGATCEANPQAFDVDNPPPFDPSEPGPDAMPMNGNPEDFGGFTGEGDQDMSQIDPNAPVDPDAPADGGEGDADTEGGDGAEGGEDAENPEGSEDAPADGEDGSEPADGTETND